jgi:hypothetical protein
MGILIWVLGAALVLSLFLNYTLLHRQSLHHHHKEHEEKGHDKGEKMKQLSKTMKRSDQVTELESIRSHHEHQTQVDGVAVALLLHAPKWFQRRYTVMVQSVFNVIPSTWKVQLFYTPSGASQVGIDLNRGLRRMIDDGKVVLTPIDPEVWSQRKKRIELMYVFCSMFFLLFLFMMASLSLLSIYHCLPAYLPACLHSLTPHGTSLTIPPSLDQSSIDTILTSLTTIQVPPLGVGQHAG